MSEVILIVEDDERSSEWTAIYLKRAGFSPVIAGDGREGLNKARSLKPAMVLLDLMLPGIPGEEFCRLLRRESEVPIIMLTAKGSREDTINGLDIGADDYIVKPFDPDELIVRIKAVLRRTRGTVQQTLICGPITLHEETEEVLVNGTPVDLSHAQFALLSAFMRHPGVLLTRQQLIEQAFRDNFDAYDRAIDTHIKRIRKLIHSESFKPIKTVYGAGYKLVCP